MSAEESLRARSLGARSRSRGRASNPSELLARKQQLVSEQLQDGSMSGNWLSSSELDSNLDEQQTARRRPSIRRAKQMQQQQPANDSSRPASQVEAKLESLSEMLKSHQLQPRAQDLDIGPEQGAKSIESVYILLAKKEKDLQLAAELGKVLLEKNDELSKANERITEDYSHKLELLEQDKHKLKRKLDLLDSEYENRLIELQTDCNILKNQLDEQQSLAKQTEKEKCKLIDDLVQQNQRLTNELVEATKSEELLSSQLEQMNERFNGRLSSRQDHATQLNALKEEIQIVNQRKQDLERRLKLANLDKNNLNLALEESSDKLLLIESLLTNKDSKLQELLEEINELRDSSSWLSNELESMINLNEKLATSEEFEQSSHHQNSSNLNKRSQLVEKLKELRLRKQSRLKATEYMLNRSKMGNNPAENNPRRRGIRQFRNKHGNQPSLLSELDSRTMVRSASSSPADEDYQDDQDDQEADQALRLADKLLIETYSLLRRFQSTLQARKDGFAGQPTASQQHLQHLYSPNSTDDSGISGDDAVSDNQAAAFGDPASWKQLLDNLKSLIEEMPCSTCYLMIGERAEFELLQKKHSKLVDELKLKSDELLKLVSDKTELETSERILNEKCLLLQNDLANCDSNQPKEEIVKLAWKARDEAVERKNVAEISLAKTRIENMQISSQLMEVVQQKGELSQKLAQFEDDIHYITQHSVKAKFTWEEYAEKMRRAKAAQQQQSGLGNPLAQLLNNFSSSAASNRIGNSGDNASGDGNEIVSKLASGEGNANSTTAGALMRNFASNRFNLKFWQRSQPAQSSDDESQPNNTAAANNGIVNNNTLVEQRVS